MLPRELKGKIKQHSAATVATLMLHRQRDRVMRSGELVVSDTRGKLRCFPPG